MSGAASRPAPKGWCPGAYRPMMSGDGLVVRIRPVMGRMERAQVLGLCDLALRFGSGLMDLTSRANVQIRGVSEADHEDLLAALNGLGLLPDDPDLEARRNVLVYPLWEENDLTYRLASELYARIDELPELPAKFGFAIDTGPTPMLQADSADIRIERCDDGVIVRAEGRPQGRPAKPSIAISQLIELSQWFDESRGDDVKRMGAHVKRVSLDSVWCSKQPTSRSARFVVGPSPSGTFYGAPFGQISATALADLIEVSGARALRTTPWRLFLLEDAVPCETHDFITSPEDPRLTVDACPGAPMCKSASVETRLLAGQLAGMTTKRLHISGCSKGCARARPASVTLIGRDGAFDLVKDGHAWDAPQLTGLSPDDLKTRIGEF